jgi:hypothetical protein
MNGDTTLLERHKKKAVGIASTAGIAGTLFTVDQTSKLSDAREQLATLKHAALVCEDRRVETWVELQDARVQIMVLRENVAVLKARP